MKLNNNERTRLRQAMLDSFTTLERLDLFVQDKLDVVLAHVVITVADLEVVVQSFIRWAEDRGRLTEFLQAALAEPKLPRLRPIATELVAKAAAAAAAVDGNGKPFVVSNRPLLDRDSLWQSV